MHEELKKYILESKCSNLKILDLGCGSPTQFFRLYSEFKIKWNNSFTYVGVDKSDEFKIYNHNLPEEALPPRFEFRPNELMISLFNSVIPDEYNFKMDTPLFEKHFTFFFLTDVFQFVSTLSSEIVYNVIILSNVLHKLDNSSAISMFNKCISHLGENSIIYVSVLKEEYNNPQPDDNLYSKLRYLELKQKVEALWCDEDTSSHFRFIAKASNNISL